MREVIFNWSARPWVCILYFASVFFLPVRNVYAQSNQTSATSMRMVCEKAFSEFFDPSYPRITNYGKSSSENNTSYSVMMKYLASQEVFPTLENTSNDSYREALVLWFSKHPWFPLYIDTGNPEDDLERYEKQKREWAAYFPEKYKQFIDLLYKNPDYSPFIQIVRIP
ncbi:MAG: hypothetical protein KKD31_08510 [Bacteroidetes bacterium]|nr:hypothetical protein [Bacteroidota bacterium]